MARHKQVVWTFIRVRKAHQAPLRPDRTKAIKASGDQLVRVNLVPCIPDQPIFGKVVNQMKSQTQFDDSQITGKMSRPFLHQIAQCFPDFVGQLNQLRVRQAAKIPGRLNSR